MRSKRIRTVVLAGAVLFISQMGANAQAQLDKVGEAVFGKDRIAKYVSDVSKAADRLRPREAETQIASRRALTFLNLVRTAKSDQEWSVLRALRPGFNASWKYLIESASVAGQELKGTSFSKEIPEVYEGSKKVLSDPQAAAEFVFEEAVVVGPYGRSAGEIFRVFQSDRKLSSDDVDKLAALPQSGIIEKIEKTPEKELPSLTGILTDCVVGTATLVADGLQIFSKDGKSRMTGILSIPGGLSQVTECVKKLI